MEIVEKTLKCDTNLIRANICSDRTPTELRPSFSSLSCLFHGLPFPVFWSVSFYFFFFDFIELSKSTDTPVFLRPLFPVTYRTHSRNITCVNTLHEPSELLKGFRCFYLPRIYVSLIFGLLAMEGEQRGVWTVVPSRQDSLGVGLQLQPTGFHWLPPQASAFRGLLLPAV